MTETDRQFTPIKDVSARNDLKNCYMTFTRLYIMPGMQTKQTSRVANRLIQRRFAKKIFLSELNSKQKEFITIVSERKESPYDPCIFCLKVQK